MTEIVNYLHRKKYYIIYTMLFVILLPLIFSNHIANGKSLVFGDIYGGGDGIAQHYTAFVYFGQYLRTIVSNLIFHHTIEIPMWDMSIGYGADIITTLNYYVLGDPFALLSVFSPPQHAETAYILSVILRFYCAGLAFLKYCHYMKRDAFSSIVGGLVYTFCGYSLLAPLLHPYFANPMIWFPLLLIGIEKIFAGEKPGWYIGFLAISACSNFYFFYMLCIMIIVYAIIRYFAVIRDRRLSSVFKWLGRFLLYSMWALGMAMVLVLPTVLTLLSQNRVGTSHYLPWLYPISYYKEFFGTFLAVRLNGYYSYMGYSVIAVPLVALLFIRRKKNTEWKWYFAVLTFMLLMPFFGCALNGFTYVTNRWVWAYSFLVSYIIVLEIPDLYDLKKGEVLELAGVSGLYIAVLAAAHDINNIRITILVLLLLICIALIISFAGKKIGIKQFQGGILLLVFVNLLVNADYAYSKKYDNYLQKQMDFGTAWETASDNSVNSIIKDMSDTQSQRYDSWGIGGDKLLRNSAMLNRVLGTSFYFSTTNDNVSQYFDEMYLNFPMDQMWDGLDGRSTLESLASVKYFIVPEGGGAYVPYGYNQLAKQERGYEVYENDNILPMVYEFSEFIPREKYESLSVANRQSALLQGVVFDSGDDVGSSLKEAKLVFDAENIPFEVQNEQGLKYEDGRIIVKEENASLQLNFSGKPESETYVMIKGMDYAELNTMESYDDAEWNELSQWTRLKRWIKAKSGLIPERRETAIYIQADNVYRGIGMRTWKDNYYCGRHNFLSSIGYREEAFNQMILTFPYGGVYTFDELEIICQPIETLNQYSSKLKNDSATLLKVNSNEYQASIETLDDKFVCFSIPYSKGWSAVVDGKNVALKRANTMFLGVEVPKGAHQITLRYETPHIKSGMIISLISIILYSFCSVSRKRTNYV